MGAKPIRFLSAFVQLHKCCVTGQGNCTPGGFLQVNIPPEGTCFPQCAKEAGSMLINFGLFGFPLDLGDPGHERSFGVMLSKHKCKSKDKRHSQGPEKQDLYRLHQNTDKHEFCEAEEQLLKHQGHGKAEFRVVSVGLAICQD